MINLKILKNEEIIVSGRVLHFRKSSKVVFMDLLDSDNNIIQIVLKKDIISLYNPELLNTNLRNSGVSFIGNFVISQKIKQEFEFVVKKIISLIIPVSYYPIPKKNIPLEVLRNYLHIRARTSTFFYIFKLRHFINKLLRNFFDNQNFCNISTPLITNSDAEGAGEVFELDENFFNSKMFLTVSGQLHAEALAQALNKVYLLSPCFRAEKSHTVKHLSEFWMLEVEKTFTDLWELMKISEDLIKYIAQNILIEAENDLRMLEKYTSNSFIISNLEKIINNEFKKISYNEAIEILKIKSEIKWGDDLSSENEQFLCEYFEGNLVFIFNYPSKIKAFYMKTNNDKTANSFDLIAPKVGEIVGGSMREDEYEKILKRTPRSLVEKLSWYLDLRRYAYLPSGGFGIGFERLVMLITGIENIKDVIGFPIFHK